ncbi:hypothetical protein NBT05_08300 [Aquimarina sp. ERC-38]|uniref:hypothetical protein n=1 Tax=Aquimarina sp. ERC-38 TaxID=2949996 RepID=UPI00224627CA|nr:hypothetical protein [Aquimarina sp. ERC-38]UZO82462.1 hypothetical protein NBT05_08300 [Aquimarina sp. ERC-38]
MKWKEKVFVSCDDANHFCDKNQYKEASLLEKVLLNVHLIYCSACRKYSSRNGKLTKHFKNPKVISLDFNTKERMQEEMKKVLQEESMK